MKMMLMQKEFHGFFPVVVTTSLLVLVSSMIGGYAFAQFKDIQVINASLHVQGNVEVGDRLCIRGDCRSAWPTAVDPNDVLAAGGVQVTYPNSYCYFYSTSWRRCYSGYGYTQPAFWQWSWYDPKGILQLNIPTGITYWGCFADGSCTTLKQHTGYASFSCRSPYRTQTYNGIVQAYNSSCLAGTRGVRSCLPSITCHTP